MISYDYLQSHACLVQQVRHDIIVVENFQYREFVRSLGGRLGNIGLDYEPLFNQIRQAKIASLTSYLEELLSVISINPVPSSTQTIRQGSVQLSGSESETSPTGGINE